MLQAHVSSATEKLRQLAMDVDNKDSGCDLDELEESSGSNHDDPEEEVDTIGYDPKELTSDGKELKVKDDSHLMQQAPPQKTVCRQTKSTGNIQRVHIVRRSKDPRRSSIKRLSVSSDTSFKQFEELRDSIAKELHQVHNLSSNLRDAIAHDLDYCRPRPMYFDIADREREISEIMAESYNLPMESSYDDSASTASSVFTYDNPVFSRKGRHSCGSSSKCSVFTTRSSRQSSFRSVASMTPDLGRRTRTGLQRNDRLGKHSSLKMHWPLYKPPVVRDTKNREETTPKTVSNATPGSKPKISSQKSDSKVTYGTYV